MYDCTQILQEFVLARYSQQFHKRLHMQFVLTFAVQVMSKDWLYDQLQWGVTKRVLFNKDPSLLYKVPSKSTSKNFVTNVYCFYL